ncbi:Gfo/Idh/MocA family protein [Sporosarcina siberiensis]|uniref:Gfo/Idh/MocA family protein n=1 Tax=Sporosarcina siberiensis TaxID=1365606 RepID=A0ABW4SKV2_9BACL
MKKTTFAIVGTGIVGERIINQLQKNDCVEIIAVFDENKQRLSEIANKYGLTVASSYDEVLSLKPNWVYIGTPPVSHASLSKRAIAENLNVLCEKPLAHDAFDGETMAKAAEESGVITAMHFPLMYSPPVRHFMEMIEKGAIGDIVRVELNTYFPHWPRLWQQNPWIGSREQGGFTREVFPHYLQLMYRMFGRVTLTEHNTVYPNDSALAETSVLAIGKTEKQIPVLLNGLTGVGQLEELSYIVYGTEGVLKLHNWAELSMAQKDRPFEILTSFDSVKTLVEECIVASQDETAFLVPFSEGLEIQRLIDQLLAVQNL